MESEILGRPPNISSRVSNFPVIDDLSEGVATSIKSLDLTKSSYQSASGLIGQLRDYAFKPKRVFGRYQKRY
jgi:hypothetical protein